MGFFCGRGESIPFFKRIFAALLLFVVVVIICYVSIRLTPLHVYDGFESPGLSWIRWSKFRFEPGAVAVENSVVKSGRQALAITVHSGDRYEAGSDTGAATERAELMESWWLYSRMGREYAYSFSLYIPKEIPQSAERLVIAQWRQLCEARRCRPDYPILAVRYEEGKIRITRRDESGSHVLYQGTELASQRWLNFRFVARFEPTNDGLVEATLEGQPIVDYHGPTTYQPAHGYPAHGLVYFKTGLYRDARGEGPWTLYVDEYRKDQCPAGGCH